jgi:8-oxo-dGTP diphosphatase
MRESFPTIKHIEQQSSKNLVAAIIRHHRRMLVVHNIKYGLRIEPPGGKTKEGETPEDAVKREVMEELGMTIKPVSLIGIYTTHSPEGSFDVRTYDCNIIEGEPQAGLEPGKIGGFEWLDADALTALSNNPLSALVPNLRAALNDILHLLNESD